MKSKLLVVLGLFCVLTSSALMASDAFSFSLVPTEPLYRSHLADSLSTSTRLHYGWFLNNRPQQVYSITKDASSGIEKHYLRSWQIDNYEEKTPYIVMKLGTAVSALRVSSNLGFLPKQISLEVTIRAMMNALFYGSHGTDQLSFDGYYGIGVNFGYSNWLSGSFGFEHNSGHYGDEILAVHMKESLSQFVGREQVYEWVRQDPIYLNISVEPISSLRLYGSVQLPIRETRILKPMYNRVSYWESIDPTGDYSWFKDWRIQTGAEFRLPIKGVGDFFVACDVVFAQAGQIVLREISDPKSIWGVSYEGVGYEPVLDRSNPWAVDVGVTVGQHLASYPHLGNLRLEVSYRYGRVPAYNFFQHAPASMVTLGFGIGR